MHFNISEGPVDILYIVSCGTSHDEIAILGIHTDEQEAELQRQWAIRADYSQVKVNMAKSTGCFKSPLILG